jgi:hypothetical protein
MARLTDFHRQHLRHTFGYALFTCFISSRMTFGLLVDSLFVAICRSNWLYSRKYGTVWYHPTSSRYYLTVFILCQFQGKLTGTHPNSDARATCVKPTNSACCVLGVRCWFYINTLFGTPDGTFKLIKMPGIQDVLDVTFNELSSEHQLLLKEVVEQF